MRLSGGISDSGHLPMHQSHLICPLHNTIDDSLNSFRKIYQLFLLYLWKIHGFPQGKSNGFEALQIFVRNYKNLMRKMNTNRISNMIMLRENQMALRNKIFVKNKKYLKRKTNTNV
ncbi:hypothetical protein H5410_002174 [Solanum commersonii]|uniref:Uncharacterized protein n=1 Tax=Solanum commersonii TaxID=4109 RepID=A0A9J6B183_SOLCO|nr:hypothetical protein H5410_002174 [Solanum commersonii]